MASLYHCLNTLQQTPPTQLPLATNDPIHHALITQLKQWGYQTEQQQTNGITINLVVKYPDYPHHALLAIETDNQLTNLDEYHFRQQLLAQKGWHHFHIWTPEWYRERERLLQQLYITLKQRCEAIQ